MGSAQCFTSNNLHSRYWKYHTADKDIPRTTFLTRYGLYKWVVMPMGLMNAPDTFIHTMINLFSYMFDSGVSVIVDDILIYSCTVKEHLTLIKKVLV